MSRNKHWRLAALQSETLLEAFPKEQSIMIKQPRHYGATANPQMATPL